MQLNISVLSLRIKYYFKYIIHFIFFFLLCISIHIYSRFGKTQARLIRAMRTEHILGLYFHFYICKLKPEKFKSQNNKTHGAKRIIKKNCTYLMIELNAINLFRFFLFVSFGNSSVNSVEYFECMYVTLYSISESKWLYFIYITWNQ